jgi:hypothetical protein
MELLPISVISADLNKIQRIKETLQSTFRLITFSGDHFADDLLKQHYKFAAAFEYQERLNGGTK